MVVTAECDERREMRHTPRQGLQELNAPANGQMY
jgi:hypothetical protein